MTGAPLSAGDQQQRRYWDDHAETYDRGMQFAERRILRDTRPWVCSRARGRTLEVAIGTGLNLPSYPADIDLVGVELSPAMLAHARARAGELGLSADLREGTAHDLAFDEGAFDTVVCTLALCSIPDHRLAITEMVRVLRPGGQLILADHVESDRAPVRLLQRAAESITSRTGEYFTRRPFRLLPTTVEVVEHERFLAGVIERLVAVKS
jgi:ubiquinone/menaquinone biosynthesis C-methylase UbiE